MMTFTVTNAPCECAIAELLEATCLSEAVDIDAISDNTYVVRVPEWGAVGLVEAAQEAGLIVHAGRPVVMNSDPTYVMAAQHIEIREPKEKR